MDYCSRYPNDITLCGCVNTQAYNEVIDYLSYTVPPSTLLAPCNLLQCTVATAWKSLSDSVVSCIQQICLQGITIGSVTDSNINKLEQNCTFSATSTTESPVNDGMGDTTSTTDEVLSGLETIFYTLTVRAISQFTWINVIVTILVILLLSIVVFLLPIQKPKQWTSALGLQLIAFAGVYLTLFVL